MKTIGYKTYPAYTEPQIPMMFLIKDLNEQFLIRMYFVYSSELAEKGNVIPYYAFFATGMTKDDIERKRDDWRSFPSKATRPLRKHSGKKYFCK